MASFPTSLEHTGQLLHCLRSEMFPALQNLFTYSEQQGFVLEKWPLFLTACSVWEQLPNAEEELKAYLYQKTLSRPDAETVEMDELPMVEPYPPDGDHILKQQTKSKVDESETTVQRVEGSRTKGLGTIAIETVLPVGTAFEHHSPWQSWKKEGSSQENVTVCLNAGNRHSFHIMNSLIEVHKLKEMLNGETSVGEIYEEEYRKQCTEVSELKSDLEILQTEPKVGHHSTVINNESNVNFENIYVDTESQLKDAVEQLNNSQKELIDTKLRLSRVMGDTLTDNNPNIADLSDQNRPTKLSERYQELYDNQWTDACERVQHIFQASEEEIIRLLKDILMETMEFCRKEAAKQMKKIVEDFAMSHKLPPYVFKQLKDIRKSLAEVYAKGMFESCMTHLQTERIEYAGAVNQLPEFVQECFELCWLMMVQDPPLEFGPESFANESFNKDLYKYYTKSGELVEYVVWPVLLLHKDGPVLSKGVAQGFKDNSLM